MSFSPWSIVCGAVVWLFSPVVLSELRWDRLLGYFSHCFAICQRNGLSPRLSFASERFQMVLMQFAPQPKVEDGLVVVHA